MIVIAIDGGLGNQMFQYAFYLRMRKGKKVKIDPISIWNQYAPHNGYELNKIFKINADYITAKEREMYLGKQDIVSRIYNRFFNTKKINFINREEAISYYENVNEFEDVYLYGYWQSEKYFYDISNEVRKAFTFPEISDAYNKKTEELINETNSVSIHFRRGDYLKDPMLSEAIGEGYYKRAIDYIKENVYKPVFFIFSNDIPWCKKNIHLDNAYFIQDNNNENQYIDMQLMSKCKHNIIANSSFSWWGAWLNDYKDKIVISPSRWFVDVNSTKDIIPISWKKI